MKITKKAKKVQVKYTESISYRPEYTCPSCKTSFVGFGPSKNVIRFRCKCGQELIVEKPLDILKTTDG